MNKGNIYIIACIIFIFVCGGVTGYYIAPKRNDYQIDRLNKKIFYDSIILQKQRKQIFSHIQVLEDLKEENYLLRNQEDKFLIKWDTAYIRILANDETDTIIKSTLEDCITNDKILRRQLSRMEKISFEQDKLIELLKDQVAKLEETNQTQGELIIEYRHSNADLSIKNKRLRNQRNVSIAGLVGLGLIFMLVK
jgi:hypothetical protein